MNSRVIFVKSKMQFNFVHHLTFDGLRTTINNIIIIHNNNPINFWMCFCSRQTVTLKSVSMIYIYLHIWYEWATGHDAMDLYNDIMLMLMSLNASLHYDRYLTTEGSSLNFNSNKRGSIKQEKCNFQKKVQWLSSWTYWKRMQVLTLGST